MRIQELPRPTRFMFWYTAPFFIVTIGLLPLLSNPNGLVGWIVLGAFETLAILAFLGLYDSFRFGWCWRIVGGMVFAGYLSYLISTMISGQWLGDGHRTSNTAFNALIGLVVFGYPGFMYAVFGRFTWTAQSETDNCHDEYLEAGTAEPQSESR